MKNAAFAVLVVFVGTACGGGGGGGGGDATIGVTFNPATVHVCAQHGYTDVATVHATATLDHVPNDIVQVRVTVTAGILNAPFITIGPQAGNVFPINAPVLSGLTLGAHTSAISFELCRDAQCASQYALSSSSLPYTVEVVDPASLSVTINGVPVSTGTPADSYNVHSGDTVVITSSAPVTWGTGSSGGPPTVSTTSQSTTSWTGVITGTPSEWIEVTASSTCGSVAQAGAFFHLQ
jgi:hypothetical protein